MSQKPLAMEQLKQILQLREDGIKIREIARRTGVSRNTVRKYLGLINDNHLSQQQVADKAFGNDAHSTRECLFLFCSSVLTRVYK